MVLPWGVWKDNGPHEGFLPETATLRARYRIGPKTIVLMTLSRISPEKGLHLLLEALRFLESDGFLQGRDLCLFICGEAAFMQGAAYKRKISRAALTLRQARVYFPGYLGPEQKRSYFSLSQLFISASIHESYGLTIVEAMRAGLAVLASDHYGVRDFLCDHFGRMVRYPSLAQAPRSLADSLRELLSDPKKLEEMGRRAQQAASEMPFSRAAKKVLDAALELLPKSSQEVSVP
jgi:glycosyltransferase involved in cell wall biosynthesis